MASLLETSNGVPVEGAVVNVTWTDSYNATTELTTDANGQVVFVSGTSHPNKWQFTITINNITKYGHFFDTANSVITETQNKHKHKPY